MLHIIFKKCNKSYAFYTYERHAKMKNRQLDLPSYRLCYVYTRIADTHDLCVVFFCFDPFKHLCQLHR